MILSHCGSHLDGAIVSLVLTGNMLMFMKILWRYQIGDWRSDKSIWRLCEELSSGC